MFFVVIGDKGFPCLTPLQYKALLLETPFSRTHEDAVCHSAEIQFLHHWPKLKYSIIFRR
jgi:hypothetical protein